MSHAHDDPLHDATRLTLVTLGGGALLRRGADGETEQVLGPGKHLALLVYLALTRRGAASRDHLIDLLWADLAPQDARHALRQAVWHLRQRLGDTIVVTHNGELVLGQKLALDRDAFLAAIAENRLDEALALYQGEFLAGFAVPGGAEFEHWADLERYRLQLSYSEAAEAVARQRLSQGQFHEAQEVARALRAVAPERQRSWRLLLESLLSGGDTVQAMSEASALERMLASHGREPEPATREILQRARSGTARVSDDEREEDTERQDAGLHAELVGREREFAAIVRAWEGARGSAGSHVAIVAAPGLGKTRLLHDVRARLRAIGATVLHARANQGDGYIGYAFAGRLARALSALPGSLAIPPACARTLVGLNPSLSATFDAAAESSREPETLRRRAIALQELLAATADEAPIAVLVDDIHWMDDQSRKLLMSLAEGIADQPVLLVTASRPAPRDALSDSAGSHLELPALTTDLVASLVGSVAGLPDEAWSQAFPIRLQAATGGSPLLVMETLQLGLERGWLHMDAGHWVCPDPDALVRELEEGSALQRRIEQLGRDESWILLLLAIAGSPIGLEQLARITERSMESLHMPLESLEHSGLVSRVGDQLEPHHDEIASRAIDAANPAALEGAHAAIGRATLQASWDDGHALSRAGPHLATARDWARLKRLFRRRLWLARAEGDRRSVGELARESLGDRVTDENVRRLVRGLPIYMKAGLSTRERLVAAVAGATVLLAVIIAVWLGAQGPVPDTMLLLYDGGYRSDQFVASVPLRRDGWVPGRTLRAQRKRSNAAPDLERVYGAPMRASPDASQWAFSRLMPDSGGIDLFVMSEDGAERRVTRARGDDKVLGWSPDGTKLLISTGRWHARGVYDLAVVHVGTDSVTQLMKTPSLEAVARWSPDGTRIAFNRAGPVGANRLHVVTADGSEEAYLAEGQLLGWSSAHEIVVLADSGGESWLARFDVEDAAMTPLTRTDERATFLSPDGNWVACLCRDDAVGDTTWMVYPTREPELSRRITLDHGEPQKLIATWRPVPGVARYLERLEIEFPPALVVQGVPHQLTASGLDQEGNSIGVHALEWQTNDATVATVSPEGALIMHQPGPATVAVSAGGWRRASAVVAAATQAAQTVFAEDWADGLAEVWTAYGDPRPSVTSGENGPRALAYNGDGSFASGVYSRDAWPATGGLGLEALVTTPIIRPDDQLLRLLLGGWRDSDSIAAWDHVTGWLPQRKQDMSRQQCSVYVSVWGGDAESVAIDRFGAGQSFEYDSKRRSDDEWYRLRVQIFPDGTCGLAVDGVAVGRSLNSVPLDIQYRVITEGKSVDTELLIGPLEVWTGIRDDVDWSEVMPGEVRRE